MLGAIRHPVLVGDGLEELPDDAEGEVMLGGVTASAQRDRGLRAEREHSLE
jgi:hypothetical protein